MVSAPSAIVESEALESPVAIQLHRGFPTLRFIAPLEAEFRSAYRTQSAGQTRLNLWLALALVLAFLAMEPLVMGHARGPVAEALRYGVIIPLVLLALAIAYSPWYERLFSPLVQVLAPIVGVSVVALDLITVSGNAAHTQTLTSAFPALLLATIYVYFLVGLHFYAALRSALIVLTTFLVGSVLVYPAIETAIYNTLVLLFTNVIGATVCYTLEKANRTSYLEARLLKEMAARDGLTGIHNRRMLDEHLERVWQQAVRDRVPTALLLVDIDYFKAYNDYYGHQAGDECLKRVANLLARAARRPLDFTARYGGEEFALVLYDARRDYVEEFAQRIRHSLDALAIKHPVSPVSRHLTVSIGAACVLPAEGRSQFGFVQLADEALYAAKARGRNCLIVMGDDVYASLSTGSFRKAASGDH
jgi:diguanylate cyclase (GGDEF)-like protein